MQWKCLWWKPLWQTYLLAKYQTWYFFLLHWGVTSIELNKALTLKCSEHSINVRHYSLVFCLNYFFWKLSSSLGWNYFLLTFLVWWHLVAQLCLTLYDPMTITYQAPLSMGFPRQEYWSGLPFPSPMHESEKWKGSRSVVSDSLWPHGLQPTRLLHPWGFAGKSTRVGCHHLLCYLYLYIVKAMAPPSSTLAWKTPWMEEPGRLQSMGSQRVGHNWATSLSLFTFMHWRRKWQPTPVFLPGESQSLVGCCLWGRTESNTTEAT